jgi:peptidoglycan-associated lipoprotein
MKKTALALASALLLLAACDSSSFDSAANGGNGMNGIGSGGGILGQTADGQNVGDRVLFETDSSVINSDGQATLENQAEWLKANSGTNVLIEGHADERGTREYNLALGERRATAAKNFLVSSGVSANRISTTSFGKERPAVLGNDGSAWSQNRRAVTVIAN